MGWVMGTWGDGVWAIFRQETYDLWGKYGIFGQETYRFSRNSSVLPQRGLKNGVFLGVELG
jgi:hypothetical protein